MAKTLYVGNLGPKADGASLKALFSMFGTVERAYIIPDKQTGQSKGYGFVIMNNDAQAIAAIKALNGKKCGEFTIKIEEAKKWSSKQ